MANHWFIAGGLLKLMSTVESRAYRIRRAGAYCPGPSYCLDSALPYVAPYCVPGGIRLVSMEA